MLPPDDPVLPPDDPVLPPDDPVVPPDDPVLPPDDPVLPPDDPVLPPDDPVVPPDDPVMPPDDPALPPDDPVVPPDDPVVPPDDPVVPPDDPVVPPDDPVVPPDDPPPALPDPEPVKPAPDTDPFKADWPKWERPRPTPAKPGRAVDFFNEDFNNPLHEWNWLSGGVKYVKGTPGVSGALEVSPNAMFHMSGNVEAAEIRINLYREMTDAEARVDGDKAKGYEVHFRYVDMSNYHALQIRGDGYYRVIRVSGGRQRTVIGDATGGYMPLPRWDRDSRDDVVVLTFKDSNMSATFNGHRLLAADKIDAGIGKIGVRSLNGLKLAIEKLNVDEVG